MLNNILSARGFKCFLDDAKIGVEDYADRIREAIKNSANFVAIITPKYFEAERINDPADWVRQEIEIVRIRKNEMNFIPLFVNGMDKSFPDNLPASIDWVRNENAFDLRHDNFEQTLERLITIGFRQDRKDQFIKALIKSLGEMNIDATAKGKGIEYITDLVMWLNDRDERLAVNWLIESIRDEAIERFRRKHLTNAELGLSEYFCKTGLDGIKKLCRTLGIDYRGSRFQLVGRIERWLTNKNYEPTKDAFDAAFQIRAQELELEVSEMDADDDLPCKLIDMALPNSMEDIKGLVYFFFGENYGVNKTKKDEMLTKLRQYAPLSVDPGMPPYENLSAWEIKAIFAGVIGPYKGKKKEDMLGTIRDLYRVFDSSTQLPAAVSADT